MRIDQSYLTLGSIVGTSCRPANTRIFLSPTRSKPAAGAAATSAASTVTRTPPPHRVIPMAVLQPGGSAGAPERRQDTIRADGPAPPRFRRGDRVARDRRLDPRHGRRREPLPHPPQLQHESTRLNTT